MRGFLNFYPVTADKSERTLLWQAALNRVRIFSIALDQSVFWGKRLAARLSYRNDGANSGPCLRHLSLLTVLSTVLSFSAFVIAKWTHLSNSWDTVCIVTMCTNWVLFRSYYECVPVWLRLSARHMFLMCIFTSVFSLILLFTLSTTSITDTLQSSLFCPKSSRFLITSFRSLQEQLCIIEWTSVAQLHLLYNTYFPVYLITLVQFKYSSIWSHKKWVTQK